MPETDRLAGAGIARTARAVDVARIPVHEIDDLDAGGRPGPRARARAGSSSTQPGPRSPRRHEGRKERRKRLPAGASSFLSAGSRRPSGGRIAWIENAQDPGPAGSCAGWPGPEDPRADPRRPRSWATSTSSRRSAPAAAAASSTRAPPECYRHRSENPAHELAGSGQAHVLELVTSVFPCQ